MTLGRKPEAIDYLERFIERGEKDTDRHPVGTMGTFNRETDIAWDAKDNMYISDGYGNSRVVKIAKDGTWVKAVGTLRQRPKSVQHGAWHRHGRTRATSMSPTAATSAFRSTTTT